MNNIGNFFDKFRNLALFELKKREGVAEAIEQTTRQKIEAKDISIKDGVVTINGNSVLKSEIFLKKGKIMSLINEKMPKLNIRDIK